MIQIPYFELEDKNPLRLEEFLELALDFCQNVAHYFFVDFIGTLAHLENKYDAKQVLLSDKLAREKLTRAQDVRNGVQDGIKKAKANTLEELKIKFAEKEYQKYCISLNMVIARKSASNSHVQRWLSCIAN